MLPGFSYRINFVLQCSAFYAPVVGAVNSSLLSDLTLSFPSQHFGTLSVQFCLLRNPSGLNVLRQSPVNILRLTNIFLTFQRFNFINTFFYRFSGFDNTLSRSSRFDSMLYSAPSFNGMFYGPSHFNYMLRRSRGFDCDPGTWNWDKDADYAYPDID